MKAPVDMDMAVSLLILMMMKVKHLLVAQLVNIRSSWAGGIQPAGEFL